MTHRPLLTWLFWTAGLYGFTQQAVVPAGGEGVGPGGTVSWTAGQVDYEASLEPGGSVQRGVQQPYEWLVTSAPDAMVPMVKVWPNPAEHGVQLAWETPLPGAASYALYTAKGAVVMQGRVDGTTLTIPLAAEASGTYFIAVQVNNIMYNRITIQKR